MGVPKTLNNTYSTYNGLMRIATNEITSHDTLTDPHSTGALNTVTLVLTLDCFLTGALHTALLLRIDRDTEQVNRVVVGSKGRQLKLFKRR